MKHNVLCTWNKRLHFFETMYFGDVKFSKFSRLFNMCWFVLTSFSTSDGRSFGRCFFRWQALANPKQLQSESRLNLRFGETSNPPQDAKKTNRGRFEGLGFRLNGAHPGRVGKFFFFLRSLGNEIPSCLVFFVAWTLKAWAFFICNICAIQKAWATFFLVSLGRKFCCKFFPVLN